MKDLILQARREAAVKEAQRIYPNVHPVLASWVFDYIESIGEQEFERRVREGFYEQTKEKLLNE